jgi:hypothetical protein
MSGIYACVMAVYVGFLGLFILSSASPVFVVLVGLLAALILSFAIARLTPLEVKQKWWAP